MKKTIIYDLSKCPLNERNGTYGGLAGEKEGITINDWYWIAKYPKSTEGMNGELDPFTTTPLSEYIGSSIYEILGLDVHKTILGIRNDMLIVACEDFCKTEGALRELRNLKIIYNKELSEQLQINLVGTSDSRKIDIEDLFVHFKYNPILKNINGVEERFWEQLIVDTFIANSDRNNGNWGVLWEDNQYRLAPIYDNGGSFANKMAEAKVQRIVNDKKEVMQSISGYMTIYREKGHRIYGKDIAKIEEVGLYEAALKIVPKIKEKMNEICDFINNIPETHEGFLVCSEARKKFYIQTAQLRLERYLVPVYDKALQYQQHRNAVEFMNEFVDRFINTSFEEGVTALKNNSIPPQYVIQKGSFELSVNFLDGNISIKQNNESITYSELKTLDIQFYQTCLGIHNDLIKYTQKSGDKNFDNYFKTTDMEIEL